MKLTNEQACGWFYLSNISDTETKKRLYEDLLQRISYIPKDYQSWYQWYIDWYKNYEDFPTWKQFEEASQMEAPTSLTITQARALYEKNLAVWETDVLAERMKGLPLTERRRINERMAQILQPTISDEDDSVISSDDFNPEGSFIITEKQEQSKFKLPIKYLNDRAVLKPGNVISVLAGPGSGKCVDYNTRVVTDYGFLKIGDLNPFWTEGWTDAHTSIKVKVPGGWAPITRFFSRKATLYRVTFDDGTYVDATDQHYLEQGVSVLKPVKFFKVGDYCNKTPLAVDFGDSLPDGYAYSYGAILGDGGVDLSKNVYFMSTDKSIVEYVRASIGATNKVRTVSREGHKEQYLVSQRLHKTLMGTLFSASCNAYTKCLSDSVFQWSLEDRLALLAGLYDTDGNLAKNGVEICSVSRELIEGVAQLASVSGFATKFRSKSTKCGAYRGSVYCLRLIPISEDILTRFCCYVRVPHKKSIAYSRHSNGRNVFQAYFSEESKTLFKGVSVKYRGRLTDTSSSRFKNRFRIDNDICCQLGIVDGASKVITRITDIQELGESQVYDIEIGTPEHVYYAFGSLTHNTSFALNTLYLNSVQNDMNTLYIYLENLPSAYYAEIYSRYSYDSGQKIENSSLKRGVLEDDVSGVDAIKKLVEDCKANTKGHYYFKAFSKYPADPLQFGAALARDVKKYNIGFVVFDYVQRAKTFAPLRIDGMTYLNQLVSTISSAALGGFDSDPFIAMLLVQPNRDGQSKAERTHGNSLNLTSIAEVSSIERDSFFAIALYSDAEGKEANQEGVKVIKSRDGGSDVSMQQTLWIPQYCLMGDVSEGTENTSNIYNNDLLDQVFDMDI